VYGTKAGLFTEPPPSLPNGRGTILAATAAAGQVCCATVSMLMERDVKAIGVDRYSGSPKNPVVHVSYIREFDKKRWLQKCKVEENRVIWASDMPNEGYHPGETIQVTRELNLPV